MTRIDGVFAVELLKHMHDVLTLLLREEWLILVVRNVTLPVQTQVKETSSK